MANLYGVANCPGQPGQLLTIGSVDITCNAGVETNVMTSPLLSAPSNGYFYAAGWGLLTIATTATPPTQLTIGIRVGSGADSMQVGVNVALLVASAALMVPIGLFTPESQVPWQGSGSTVSIGVTPTGNSVVCRVQGSSVAIGLLRGIDV